MFYQGNLLMKMDLLAHLFLALILCARIGYADSLENSNFAEQFKSVCCKDAVTKVLGAAAGNKVPIEGQATAVAFSGVVAAGAGYWITLGCVLMTAGACAPLLPGIMAVTGTVGAGLAAHLATSQQGPQNKLSEELFNQCMRDEKICNGNYLAK
jgi:hypothetical protein